ncbi:MAG TPA: hypothetical protein VFH80_25755 [Solirubrobacteraceae bacterium]|nr:hypothetical protein [Solirubrobacteraceae bacterium]
MSPITHQTVRLSRGKHSSEEHGACVMELASMLAGEPFSDHPQSVCPVIAAVLRAYNDWVDDERRQELYEYAAKVVGSRASTRIERARAKQMISWIAAPPPGRIRRWLLPGPRAISPWPPYEALGTQAVRVLAKRGRRDLLACVDRLLEMGAGDAAGSVTALCAPPASAPSPRSPAHTSR